MNNPITSLQKALLNHSIRLQVKMNKYDKEADNLRSFHYLLTIYITLGLQIRLTLIDTLQLILFKINKL